MKIVKINYMQNAPKKRVYDCSIGDGYQKMAHGSLPDVDIDFAADRREEVKHYLERRYNKDGLQRVFSAGTFTTVKIKTGIKDVGRTHRVPVGSANYITAMLDDDNMTWTDFMRFAFKNKRVKEFVEKYFDTFEEIPPLMGETRSAGIHASAVIVTPEYVKGKKVSCFDLLPIRKMDGLLVSEISGNDIDAIGILKCDALAIQELTRLSDMLHLIETRYSRKLTILQIVTNELDKTEVYDLISKGYTQGVFQMSGEGITRFIKQLKPACIDDMIAMVAIYRPGALSSGAAMAYVDYKNNPEIEPNYLWGTYDTLKSTHGQIIYQEQVAELARKIGGLTLGEGVNLVKALSKKKLEKVRKFKTKFFEGAKKNGCPDEAAKQIWDDTEKASTYLFNKSHSTAYGLTAFVGAWIKTYYPMPFYSVVLRDVKDEKLPAVMNEIEQFGQVKLCQPDINISGRNFVPDYDNNRIYWSLARIKWVGLTAVDYIVKERQNYGKFTDMEEFIGRMFRGRLDKKSKKEKTEDDRNPVNIRVVRMLIYAGAFDECEHLQSVCDRYKLLQKAMEMLGGEINESEVPPAKIDKHYFWSQLQITYTGFGNIDYKAIWKSFNVNTSNKWLDFNDLNGSPIEKDTRVTAATIIEVHDKTYTSRRDGSIQHYGKILLQQNTQTSQLTIWGDAWLENQDLFIGREKDIVAATVMVKYSDYDSKNVLQINKGAFVGTIKQ